MAACARRETLEEAGLAIDPARVAFIAETLAPGSARRAVDLVFLAGPDVRGDPAPSEPGLEVRPARRAAAPGCPPAAGRAPACLHARGREPTPAYLGNLWRPQGGTGAARLEAAGEPAGGGLP